MRTYCVARKNYIYIFFFKYFLEAIVQEDVVIAVNVVERLARVQFQ